MNKEEAIDKVKEFIKNKKFSWEVMYHVDQDPTENSKFWIFKNLWEARESIRGDQLNIDWDKPRIVVDKESGIIREVTNAEFKEINALQ